MLRSSPRTLVSSLALLAVAVCGCPSNEPAPDSGTADAGAPAAASLRRPQGEVQWRSGPAGDWRAATDGQELLAGAGLRTGPDGRVEVVFADGRALAVQPGSELELEEVAGRLEFSLAGGEVELESSGERASGFRLVIDDQDQRVELHQGRARLRRLDSGGMELAAAGGGRGGFRLRLGDESEMQVQREGQLRIDRQSDGLVFVPVVGEIEIRRGDQTRTLKRGATFRLRFGEGKVTARQRIAATLHDRKRSARIRAPNTTRFVSPGRRAVELKPGTEVANRGKAPVEIADQAGGRVLLSPGSKAIFQGSFRSDQGREGVLALERGEARVKLRRQGGAGSTQEVATPQARIVASAQGLTAEVTVQSRKDSTRVLVHTGRAEVEVGDRTIPVSAGQQLSVGASASQAAEAKPVALAGPPVRIREGARSRVFYDRPVSRVGLTWNRPAVAGRDLLEISRAADFDPLLIQEPVSARSFQLTGLRPGKLFWRLRRAGKDEAGPVGSLELARDPASRNSKARKLNNVVQDTGVQTRIIFQGKVPQLTFRWQAQSAASRYRVRIYSSEDLETPLIDRQAEKARLVLPAGRLKEGTYFWYQEATDASGRTLHTSQMNKLVLDFDNATTLMRIDTPRPGARPAAGSVTISGLAPRGAEVTVNHRPVLLGPDGRFDQSLAGVAPGSTLVFHLQRQGLGDVYYLRHLGR